MLHSPERRPAGGLVIFADEHDWHLARLEAALAARGVTPVIAPLSAVTIAIGAAVPVVVPGCRGRLPRAALVRGLAGGSFEAISSRLGILRGLQAMGVTVWNGADAIAASVDKGATSLALSRAGLPTPPTFVTADRNRALDLLAREIGLGHKLVLKPLFGAQGRGLRLLERVRDLPDPDEVDGVFYLQRYIPPADGVFRDFRVFVSGGAAVAGMARRGVSWITNVHQGARPEPVRLDREMERLAISAAATVGTAFAGVDLMIDAAGRPTVLEVNSMPAWRGLQAVAPVDVAERLVADWLAAAGFHAEAPAAR